MLHNKILSASYTKADFSPGASIREQLIMISDPISAYVMHLRDTLDIEGERAHLLRFYGARFTLWCAWDCGSPARRTMILLSKDRYYCLNNNEVTIRLGEDPQFDNQLL